MYWILGLLALSIAQDAPILTLEDAVAEAVRNQPLLEVYRQESHQAQARYRRERAAQYPAITLTAQLLGGSNNSSSAGVMGMTDFPSVVGIASSSDIPTIAHPSYVPRTNSFVGIGAHYRLLDFGYTSGRIDAAQADADAARAFARQALQDIIYRVAQAYLTEVAARQTLLISKDAQSRAQEHHNLAHAGVQSGMRPAIDMARSDAELAAATLGVIRAQNSLTIARSALNTAIGWGTRFFSVVPPPEPTATPPPTERIFDLALSNRPDMAAYTAQERAADRLLASMWALNFPQIDATASASARGVNEAPHAFNYDVGLILTLPLFCGFAIETQNDEARALLASARARKRVLKDAIAQQLEEARDTLLSTTEAVKVANIQVAGALATLNQAEARYREGLGNIVELTDAQAQYDSAQQSVIQSRLAQAVSDVQLKYVYAALPEPRE